MQGCAGHDFIEDLTTWMKSAGKNTGKDYFHDMAITHAIDVEEAAFVMERESSSDDDSEPEVAAIVPLQTLASHDVDMGSATHWVVPDHIKLEDEEGGRAIDVYDQGSSVRRHIGRINVLATGLKCVCYLPDHYRQNCYIWVPCKGRLPAARGLIAMWLDCGQREVMTPSRHRSESDAMKAMFRSVV